MQPFATFNTVDERVRLRANRGDDFGIWMVEIAIATNAGTLTSRVTTKAACHFWELRDQQLNSEIGELFDVIEKSQGERPTIASFTVYKLRGAKRGN